MLSFTFVIVSRIRKVAGKVANAVVWRYHVFHTGYIVQQETILAKEKESQYIRQWSTTCSQQRIYFLSFIGQGLDLLFCLCVLLEHWIVGLYRKQSIRMSAVRRPHSFFNYPNNITQLPFQLLVLVFIESGFCRWCSNGGGSWEERGSCVGCRHGEARACYVYVLWLMYRSGRR